MSINTVASTATCSRCGSQGVAWVQARSGRFYLAEAYLDNGRTVVNTIAFHSKTCTGSATPPAPVVVPEGVVNEHVGQVGDKINVEGELTGVRPLDSAWGTSWLYTIKATDGHIFKWFASANVLGEEAGPTVSIKGTIKKHDDYRGSLSTVLTRCRVL